MSGIISDNVGRSSGLVKAAGGGGKVLQVVEGELTTEASSSATTYQAGGLTVDITPSATSSKVLVFTSFSGSASVNTEETSYTIYRDSTNLAAEGAGSETVLVTIGNPSNIIAPINMQALDSPSSTSALTYEVYYKSTGGDSVAYVNKDATLAKITVMEIGA